MESRHIFADSWHAHTLSPGRSFHDWGNGEWRVYNEELSRRYSTHRFGSTSHVIRIDISLKNQSLSLTVNDRFDGIIFDKIADIEKSYAFVGMDTRNDTVTVISHSTPLIL